MYPLSISKHNKYLIGKLNLIENIEKQRIRNVQKRI
jgi:hypothetical protein